MPDPWHFVIRFTIIGIQRDAAFEGGDIVLRWAELFWSVASPGLAAFVL